MRAIEPRDRPDAFRGDVTADADDPRSPSSHGPLDESAANEDFLFHLYRGSELLQDNRVLEAKGELERALHLQPRDAKGQDLLAVVYFRLGLYPRAIAIYERLLRVTPQDPALLLNLSLCYLKTGQSALAKRELETLVGLHPNHARAWGYLGLAYDRLGELTDAETAFRKGGHAQMVRRVEEKRNSLIPPAEESFPPLDIREAARAAFEELDAGELSFALAEPASDARSFEDEWRPVEIGQPPGSAIPRPLRQRTERPAEARSPGAVLHMPQLGVPSEERRPTLIVGVAPAAPDDIAAMHLPAPRAPTFSLDEAGTPSLHVAPRAPSIPDGLDVESTKGTAPPPARAALSFPDPHGVELHSSGVALVRVAASAGFTTRLEAIRTSTSSLVTNVAERRADGRATGVPFGGIGSPMVKIEGDGRLVLGPRPGRKLFVLPVHDTCFVREDVLVGWNDALDYENGQLATSDRESTAIVQLRGRGSVVVESFGELLELEVHPNAGVRVRREVLLGWFGRLVPRALPPNEAPCAQRGLVSFAGEGKVLVTSV